MAKKTKTETLIEEGYSKHNYPTAESANKFRDAFQKKGRDAHYIRSGKAGNYQHNVLEK